LSAGLGNRHFLGKITSSLLCRYLVRHLLQTAGAAVVFLPVILLAYMGLTQAVKGFYIRRFGWQ
jgi:hypothetical protein